MRDRAMPRPSDDRRRWGPCTSGRDWGRSACAQHRTRSRAAGRAAYATEAPRLPCRASKDRARRLLRVCVCAGGGGVWCNTHCKCDVVFPVLISIGHCPGISSGSRSEVCLGIRAPCAMARAWCGCPARRRAFGQGHDACDPRGPIGPPRLARRADPRPTLRVARAGRRRLARVERLRPTASGATCGV